MEHKLYAAAGLSADRHLDINQPMTGAEIDKLIAGLYATPNAVVERRSPSRI